MQVESPSDILTAYANQLRWLESRLETLKKAETPETDPAYVKMVGEVAWCKNAHSRLQEILVAPKGFLVLVLKSKSAGLKGKVGKVTYVNEKHNFATVSFDGDTHSHNLGIGNLLIVNPPVPSMKIPSAGMTVTFKGDSEDYMALSWNAKRVYVELMASVRSGGDESTRADNRVWRERTDVVTINGVPAL